MHEANNFTVEQWKRYINIIKLHKIAWKEKWEGEGNAYSFPRPKKKKKHNEYIWGSQKEKNKK